MEGFRERLGPPLLKIAAAGAALVALYFGGREGLEAAHEELFVDPRLEQLGSVAVFADVAQGQTVEVPAEDAANLEDVANDMQADAPRRYTPVSPETMTNEDPSPSAMRDYLNVQIAAEEGPRQAEFVKEGMRYGKLGVLAVGIGTGIGMLVRRFRPEDNGSA